MSDWKPNAPFLWMAKGALQKIRESFDQAGIIASAINVYTAFSEVASDKGSGEFQTTHSWLASLSGLSVRTVQDRLRDLSRIGLVEIKTPALKSPSTYRLLPFGNGCRTISNGCRTFGKPEGGSVADIERTEEQRKEEEASKAPSLESEVIAYWNTKAETGLPKVKKVTDDRKRALKQRLADSFFRENYQAAIDRICKSVFCLGKNERGWRADIDYFLKPGSVVKIMEGKYDNRNGHAPPVQTAPPCSTYIGALDASKPLTVPQRIGLENQAKNLQNRIIQLNNELHYPHDQERYPEKVEERERLKTQLAEVEAKLRESPI